MRSLRHVLSACVVLAALAGGGSSLAAQGATGSVRGKVVEAGSLKPLAGAQVYVPGSGRGALTSASGEYVLTGVPVGQHTLRADMLGYKQGEQSVTIAAGQAATADFNLSATAISMNEIVVTGTAGAVSKRTLGNSITKVDAADVVSKTASSNVAELLQSRAPGLSIVTNAGTPGAAPDIHIRGNASFLGNSPVVYIDGVRVSTDALGNFTPSGASTTNYRGQTTSALDLINPNDIESIEVIKGPAAATLYGADAAGGVIQIITKKGVRGAQEPMRFDVRAETGLNDWALDTPINTTVCDETHLAAVDASGAPVWPGCQGKPAGTVLRDEPMRRDPLALRSGAIQNLAISARGGSNIFSYYVSAQTNNEQGVFLNSYDDRKSIRANFTASPSPKLDFQISTSYVNGDLRLPLGDESAEALLLSAARGQPGHVPVNGDSTRMGWYGTTPKMANDYNNTTNSDRFLVGATINARPFDWFRNRLTVGMDYQSGLAQIVSPPGSVDADYGGIPEGVVAQRFPRTFNYTIDYAGNLDFALNSNVQSTTSFGVQAISKKYQALYAQGTGFGAPDLTLIGTAATNSGSNSFYESKSLGLFGQEQVGWKDRLYLTGAVRMDNSSVFGDEIKRIFYPKASVSYIISDEPGLKDFFSGLHINNVKLRAAYGHAGRAPAPFSAAQVYTADKGVWGENVVSALRASAYGNPDLKPERGEELEAGFDAGLFQDRLGVEFTYYHKQMNDVIVPGGVAGSSGFGSTFYGSTSNVLVNLGQTLNTGIEVALNATPVQQKDLVWDARLNFSTNHNKLLSLGGGATSSTVSGQSYGTVQVNQVGYPLAGYWAKLAQRNPDGTPVLDPNTGLALQTADPVYIGPAMPTREAGLANTFTLFRNWQLYAFLDYKGGNYLFNYKEFSRCRVYANCSRMSDPNNINLATGEAKNPEVAVWRTNIPGEWIEKADFVKLRDVSLTYSLPTPWANKFRASAASVTVAGHNLAQFTGYSGIDPEVNSYGDTSFARADVYPAPMMRRVSLSVNLSF